MDIFYNMNTFTKEEYLALVEKMSAEHYGEEGENEPIWEPDPAPEKASRIHLVNKEGCVDLTKANKDKVRDILFNYKYANLAIGDFVLRIYRFVGEPGGNKDEIKINLTLHRYVYRTPAGAPCKMLNKFYIHNDSRFERRPWLTHFGIHSNYGNDIPLETMVEIVRWMQVVEKLPAFV